MASFKSTVITERGHNLMIKIASGTTKMRFTKIRISDSTPSDSSLPTLTELSSIKQTVDISSVKVVNSATVKVSGVISNTDLAIGYYVRTIGLYAQDPDLGEILYSVTKAIEANWMSPNNGTSSSSLMISLLTVTSNAADITIDVEPAAVATINNINDITLETNNIKGFVGYSEKNVLGIEWDVVNKTVTRLGDAIGKNAGADFDIYNMYGNRKKCIVTDTGIRLAYLGETGYTETGKLTSAINLDGVNYPVGTSVQVMVEQPAFWYKAVPIDFKKISGRRGLSVQKIRYYISETARFGFKLHPAFYTRESNKKPVPFIYLSAYEGCAYDTSAESYILNDEQIVDFTAITGDKLSSIANAKPISGLTQDFTRAKARIIANNRGTGWQLEDIFSNSASQLLFAIEYGSFDTQNRIGRGVVDKPVGSGNESEPTGATYAIGNGSGMAVGTDGLVSVIYRGQENFWGNIWKWEDGLNVYADGVNNQAYIAYSGFADSVIADPYFDVGFELANTNGYISAIGWSEVCDFAFLPTETLGADNKPIEDYFYQDVLNGGHKVSSVGGSWTNGLRAGGFYRSVNNSPSEHYLNYCARVLFVPPAA
ncbi:MAG: phage tail protein [Tissierellaceae bacterium]|nr:phage tail protein [Tissierellaceae bacterium]